jgi:two-component system, NarL family, sensor histidine kinase UhpB
MAVKFLSNSIGAKQSADGFGYSGTHIADIINNGFFKVDRQWTVRYWNKAAEKILGVDAKGIVGKNIWDVFAGSLSKEFCASYRLKPLQEIPAHFEEYWPEIGSWFDVITYYFDDNLSVSFKSHGQSAHSKHADHPEQQLKVLNELYRFVTEVTNDCLWEWDLQHKELFWIDGGHKRVFGYPIENTLVPQSFWENLLHPDDKERILRKLSETLAGRDDHWEVEYRFRKANGTYAFVQDRARIFFDDKNSAATMIGATQDITKKVLMENELMEERLSKQKEITEAVLKAHENERTAIGKELHDNLNQVLGAAKLYIEMAKTDEEVREMCLDRSSGYIMKVIEEIRKLSKALASPSVHLMGLSESIRTVIDDLVVVHPIRIEFHENGIVEKELKEKLQLDILRIVQEQLNNVIKHANATLAIIHLNRLENEITLVISDNGDGCDTSIEKLGVGLINIRSRAEANHGRVTIASKLGEGYMLKVILRLSGAAK